MCAIHFGILFTIKIVHVVHDANLYTENNKIKNNKNVNDILSASVANAILHR